MNKVTHKAEAAEPQMSRNRYSELKQMLDERRREIHAEVQGKMRGVREEGTWGGKLNEVLDAVESAEAECVVEKCDDGPDRYHNNHADDAIYHVQLSFFVLSAIFQIPEKFYKSPKK